MTAAPAAAAAVTVTATTSKLYIRQQTVTIRMIVNLISYDLQCKLGLRVRISMNLVFFFHVEMQGLLLPKNQNSCLWFRQRFESIGEHNYYFFDFRSRSLEATKLKSE